MKRGLAGPLERVDQALALHWWWRWQLERSERRLALALSSPEDSLSKLTTATHAVRRAQFAVDYGRPATPEVQAAVHRAAEAGVPKHALRLMVANLDVRTDDEGRVYVRRAWWLTTLAWICRILVVLGMAYIGQYILAHPTGLPLVKGVMLLAFGLFFFAMAYVWDLFGIRATRAVRTYARHFEMAERAKAK